MSYVDLQQLSPRDLVAQYVIQQRGFGHFLPYDDHQLIDEWLRKARNPDDVLLALSDVLPSYFARPSNDEAPRKPPSLKGIHKRVLKAIDRIVR